MADTGSSLWQAAQDPFGSVERAANGIVNDPVGTVTRPVAQTFSDLVSPDDRRFGRGLGELVTFVTGAKLAKELLPAGDVPKIATTEAARGGVSTVARGGETAATAYGRIVHKVYEYGPGFEKEFTLENGQRVDAVNFRGLPVSMWSAWRSRCGVEQGFVGCLKSAEVARWS